MSIYHDEELDGVRYSNSAWAESEGIEDYYEYAEQYDDEDKE